MPISNFLFPIWSCLYILSRASEVGSPTNHLGSRQRRDTGQGCSSPLTGGRKRRTDCWTCFTKAGWAWHVMIIYTVEPRPVDTPLLWTPHHCGRFSPGPFAFPYIILWPLATTSFTSVDTSLLWTLFVRPWAVHISEVLLCSQKYLRCPGGECKYLLYINYGHRLIMRRRHMGI